MEVIDTMHTDERTAVLAVGVVVADANVTRGGTALAAAVTSGPRRTCQKIIMDMNTTFMLGFPIVTSV